MDFKAGDNVVCIDDTRSPLREGDTYIVVCSVFGGDFLKVEGFNNFFDCDRFKKATPDLETELRLCESRRDIVVGRVSVLKQEEMSLESRIYELQQAIKKRDKPKGRVGLKDCLSGVGAMYLVCANGCVKEHRYNFNTTDHISMGNLFYDKESAERAVHDRKQRVLRGEDV